MALNGYQPIMDVLAALDGASVPLHEMEVVGRLHAVAPKSFDGLQNDQIQGAIADLEAFRFQPSRGPARQPWGIYWSSLSSAVTADGVEVFFPDVAQVTEDIVRHWIAMSMTLAHPVLRARYADLAWEIGRYLKRPPKNAPAINKIEIEIPVALVQRAIDAYLESVERRLSADEYHLWMHVERAVSLAASINDADRLAKAKVQLFALRRELENGGEKFMWWRFDDIVWEHAKALNVGATETQESIESIERVLAISSNSADGDRFDPHDAASAADRLARRRAQTKEFVAGIRAMRTAAQAMEKAASLANGLTAIAMLEGLIPRYRNAGLPDDVARVESAIRERAAQANSEMKITSVPVSIPIEEMDLWCAPFLEGPLDECLSRFASACLLHEQGIQDQLKDLAEGAPLWSMMSSSVMGSDGFTTATIGSIEVDLDGRSIQHAANFFAWHAPWLHYALNRMKESHALTTDKLLGVIRACAFFKSEREALLAEGIAAWLVGDSSKAIHILVPQIEAALRDMLAALGAPVTEPDHNSGGFLKIGLGRIISHPIFIASVSKDIRFHLRALYSDVRGINLRNNLAHGLASANLLNAGTANWVVHTVLLIGAMRIQDRN